VRTICLPRSLDITIVHVVFGELLSALAAGELTLMRAPAGWSSRSSPTS
jgi:hypothetical protein